MTAQNPIKSRLLSPLQAYLQPKFAQLYLSQGLQQKRRFCLQKIHSSDANTLYFFCQLGDPQSYILSQALSQLALPSGISLEIFLVNYSHPSTHPEPEKSRIYHLADAQFLANQYDLNSPQDYPSEELTQAYLAELLTHKNLSLSELNQRLNDYWQAKELDSNTAQIDQNRLSDNNKTLTKFGHYASASLYFRGDFYTGLDRIGYLQQALNIPQAQQVFSRQQMQAAPSELDKEQDLEVFFSFRSPYSYLAIERLARLGLKQLTLRPVLPMVMRGLPVPASKRFYILRDAKREADSLDIPFGKIKDPVGQGVENCLAIYFYAEQEGKALAFARLALQQIWSQGVDMTNSANLEALCQQLDLDWSQASARLEGSEWQTRAEANRETMFGLGVWGVPSFHNRAKQTTLWGQDRLVFALQS